MKRTASALALVTAAAATAGAALAGPGSACSLSCWQSEVNVSQALNRHLESWPVRAPVQITFVP